MKKKQIGAVAALLLAATVSPQAAYITIDDSDPNNITLTAGDFEFGFSVNGVPLNSGLFVSDSITLPDGGYTFEGSWIDLGKVGGGAHAELLFADAGDTTAVMSGVIADAVTNADGNTASLVGSTYGGYTGSFYFLTGNSTFPQNGGPQSTALPFLSIEFIPETTAPDGGSTALLMGAAISGIGALSRRLRK